MKKIQLRDRHKHPKPREKRAGLSSFSQELLGNIYQAITGNVPIPAQFLRRALANGLPQAEFQDAIRCARTAKALPDYLLSASEQKLERALYWDELGLKTRSRDLYLESTLWGIFAELLCEEDEKKKIVWQKFRESYRRAAPYFNHPAEEVQISYLASALSGYFRLPSGFDGESLKRLPVVVILNSFFSAREELHYLENSLLSQEFATLSIDYPGEQNHSGQLPAGLDVKELGNAIYLYLSTRAEIDSSRITLYGQSLGGRLGIYMLLSCPERFSSLVSVSTPLNLFSELDRTASQFARDHMVSTYAAKTAIYDLALHTQIEEALEQIEAPFLVVGGGKDKTATAEQSRELFDRSCSADKKLVLCPGAGHCLYEMMPSLRYEIAQWIKQRA